jgi:hypothetical protein
MGLSSPAFLLPATIPQNGAAADLADLKKK